MVVTEKGTFGVVATSEEVDDDVMEQGANAQGVVAFDVVATSENDCPIYI